MSNPTGYPYNPNEMLSTVALVKAEPGGGINNSNEDNALAGYINGISLYWLRRTGMYSLSTLNDFTETYNGNGHRQLSLKQQPANSVATLQVGNVVIPPSASHNQPGYVLSDDGKSIILRGYVFTKGLANVFITYNAGYDGVPGDIQQAATRHVVLAYKRKDSINERGLSTTGGNTTFLNEIVHTPDIEAVIRLHSRLGM